MKYYRLSDDVESMGRWFLKGPTDTMGRLVDADLLSQGKRTDGFELLRYSLRRQGKPLALTFADFDVLVGNAQSTNALCDISPKGVQIIHTEIETSEDILKNYYVINITDTVRCMDETNSDIVRWTASDGRPEKIGHYRMVTHLSIIGSLAAGHHIFRLAGWEVAVIIDDKTKNILQEQQTTGVLYNKIEVH